MERMNKEVSCWMRGVNKDNDTPEIPFIATRGYDSVVWNRLYSKDSAHVDYRTWKVINSLNSQVTERSCAILSYWPVNRRSHQHNMYQDSP